jgi:DNA-directed RNA polymerase specialized sigma24 family protein
MSSGYVIPIDPTELATRFSHDDPRFDQEDEEIEDDMVGNVSADSLAECFPDGDYESRIAPLLDRIPEREADLIFLYFIQKKRQADIATIFGVTQAAISYRLDRGIKRLKFLLAIPQLSEDELRADLPAVFPQKIDVDILVGMWETTCQSEVATTLGLTQGRVRHRFFKAVQTLEVAAKEDERFLPYQKIFSAIASKKFNILREVKLPQWQDRGGDECI